ncbi:beta-ketoacyl synthase N-terminal-like domain-containing protein [Urechidicola vernalis]|uniref:Beta-ketoacyl synthase N-terminal-like domain-containing protein n=1 Tax=Urechidicola vernalis TaxID=3075600 RepID=A0ABU2Y7T8_9FLAO|nr:beta-ketoacyl synthase N-terminal-like domain-containing protein [Urechidicola sp. P050]MDT0554256.1 beta-ketoacyl synthase N-terminal-like domain-containing protein [Urechidicola sp. P050]
MIQPISITALSSISPLGISSNNVWTNYLKENHHFSKRKFNGVNTYVADLSEEVEQQIGILKKSDKHYKDLDKSVLMAIIAARNTVAHLNWKEGDFGVNIGSSRGATELFEKYHQDYLQRGKTETLSSPTTTLGNISSWIAHDLQSQGPTISHSITCSTALHSVLNGVAWINSGMSEKFLVGGSEAPLTDFTIAQMKALKIYAPCHTELVEVKSRVQYPCKTLDFSKKKNSMILGEGACVLALEKGKQKNALGIIEGIGYATEILEHNISISDDAICFQKSMKMAMKNIDINEVDAIVMHAPGTLKGDTSEYKAIQKVFGNGMPVLTSNKWKIGHTFGASGALSLELAILMLEHQEFIGIPFLENQKEPKKLNKILVNAVGFGGNAVSILVSKE